MSETSLVCTDAVTIRTDIGGGAMPTRLLPISPFEYLVKFARNSAEPMLRISWEFESARSITNTWPQSALDSLRRHTFSLAVGCMKTFTADLSEAREASRSFLATALRLLISGIRLALVMPLVILEPVVSFMLMAIAMCGLLMCLFNRFLVHDPRFPFWLMLSLSIGSAFLLLPYYALIRLLSRNRWH